IFIDAWEPRSLTCALNHACIAAPSAPSERGRVGKIDAWRMDSILVTLQTMFAHSPERGGDTRTQRASKRTPGVRLSLRSEGLGMIQRTLILSLVCVGVTALAACGTP